MKVGSLVVSRDEALMCENSCIELVATSVLHMWWYTSATQGLQMHFCCICYLFVSCYLEGLPHAWKKTMQVIMGLPGLLAGTHFLISGVYHPLCFLLWGAALYCPISSHAHWKSVHITTFELGSARIFFMLRHIHALFNMTRLNPFFEKVNM